jgi:NAD(P)-dependent dehydrogenase (short-subunit alcohol dehydrogenase family)
VRFVGKSVIVTGATSGIGRATAVAFAREGAMVVINDLQEERGNEVVAEIQRAGGEAVFAPGDVSCPGDNEQLIDACMARYGKLDILCCNAGINLAKSITDTNDDEMERLLAVNVKAIIYAARYAVPIMLHQGGGVIIVVASKTGLVAQYDSPVYCASKGAAVLLAKALALDYATRNVRVNAVCPGIIDTPMLQKLAEETNDPQAKWKEYESAQPMRRLGTAQECANAILWLASEEASFVTGIALPVDGGFVAM